MICEVTSEKHAWVSLEKIWIWQMGRLEEKIVASLLYCLHSFPFGLFNVFQQKTFVRFPARLFFGVIHRVRLKNNLRKSTLAFNVG
jgi:hypothetical protein